MRGGLLWRERLLLVMEASDVVIQVVGVERVFDPRCLVVISSALCWLHICIPDGSRIYLMVDFEMIRQIRMTGIQQVFKASTISSSVISR